MKTKNHNTMKAKASSLTALLVSVLIVSALTGLQFISKVSADYPYDWPMFGNDPQHTGYSESPAPNTNQTLWSSIAAAAVSSPAVVDGKVYVGSYDNNTYCFDAATGALIWNYTTGDYIMSSPAVVDAKVYIGSFDDNLYCLDAASGALIWNYKTGDNVESCPAVVDGKVYVGSHDDNLYCLDAETGEKIWNYTTSMHDVRSSPVVTDGKVYVGSFDRNVYCLDALTGALVWNYTTGAMVFSSPAVVDGRVHVGANDGVIYTLNALTGELIWNYSTGGIAFPSPAVADARVYGGSFTDKTIYCLDAATGASIWNYTTGAGLYSSPAIADGNVYIGSNDGKVYCLDAASGALIWSYTTGDRIWASPTVANGVVYIGSSDGLLYAFSDLDAPIPALYDWDVGVEVGDTFRYKGTLVLWESESASFPPMESMEFLQTWNESDWLEYKVTAIEELIVTFEVTTHWKNGTETVSTLEENMTSTTPLTVIGANLVEGTEIRPEILFGVQTMPTRYLNASIMREYESGSKETNVMIWDWNFFDAVYHYEYLFDKETGINVYFQSSGIGAFDTNFNTFNYNCTLELIETNRWTVIPEFPTGTAMLLIFVAITISIRILSKRTKRKRW